MREEMPSVEARLPSPSAFDGDGQRPLGVPAGRRELPEVRAEHRTSPQHRRLDPAAGRSVDRRHLVTSALAPAQSPRSWASRARSMPTAMKAACVGGNIVLKRASTSFNRRSPSSSSPLATW